MRRLMAIVCLTAVAAAVLLGCKQPAVAVPAVTAAQVTTVPTPSLTPEPTPTPAPTPSPTPTPITDAMLDAGAFDAFFDDALFIGDSITRDLHRYALERRNNGEPVLGDASYLYSAGYHLKAAVTGDSSYGFLTYRGEIVGITDAINAVGAKKVFLLMGGGDLKSMMVDRVTERYGTLIDMIGGSCPGVELLVVQSITPVSPYYCSTNEVTMPVWNSVGDALQALCEEKDVEYLDFAPLLRGEDGYLLAEMTYDGYHLSPAGLCIWIHELRKFAMEQTGTGGAVYVPDAPPTAPTAP